MIGERIDFLDTVDFVIPPGNSQHMVTVCHEDIHRFAFHPEVASLQFYVVSYIQRINQLAQEYIAVQYLSFLYLDDIFLHGSRSPHTIDAGNRGNHDDILST